MTGWEDETAPQPTGFDPDDEATLAIVRNNEAWLAPGRMLGEYRIAKVAGVGGMGIVLGAIHPLIGKRVAIKVLKTTDPAMISRFIDEASVVNQIRHPNIVDVFGFGTTPDGRRYLVMEWLDGESLRAAIDRGPLSAADVVAIMRPLLRALAAAHDMGVIHRDLKPENIFLAHVIGEPPLVKLLDFGISKVMRADHVSVVQTASGVMVGTPAYAAPEQAAGKTVDHRIDIYALGTVMFEMMTGRAPFIAESAMLVVAKHMLEPAPRMSSLYAVPRILDDLVLAMLDKNPDNRPSLAHVAAALDQVERGAIEMVQTCYGPTSATRVLHAPQMPQASAIDLPTAPMIALPVDAPPPIPTPPRPSLAPVVQPRRIPILVYVVLACAAIAAGIKIADLVTSREAPAPTVTPRHQ